MKTQTKIIPFAVLLLAANAVSAQSSNNANVNEVPQQKFTVEMKVTPQAKVFMTNVSEEANLKYKVWFANPAEEKVTLTISSQDGGYYYTKQVSDAWYSQTFNFAGVEEGIYLIEIKKGKEYFRKSILVAKD